MIYPFACTIDLKLKQAVQKMMIQHFLNDCYFEQPKKWCKYKWINDFINLFISKKPKKDHILFSGEWEAKVFKKIFPKIKICIDHFSIVNSGKIYILRIPSFTMQPLMLSTLAPGDDWFRRYYFNNPTKHQEYPHI